MSTTSYKEAKNKFLSYDFNAPKDFFLNNGHLLEYGYCELLSGDVEEAKKVFRKISQQDMRADWGLKLTQFINCYVTEYPTFFQIRDFLEIDLNLLIQAGQAQFVENIINGVDLFYQVNKESYKFIARVLMQNDYPEVAYHFLIMGKDKFYCDPELHLILANCYLKKGNKKEAKKSAQNCLRILPQYIPAKKLLESLN